MPDYRPVDPRKSPRFAGIKTFMRLPHLETTEGIDFAVVGVPFDTGASFRVGARFGPEAIRSVSASSATALASSVLAVGVGYAAARWDHPAPAPPPHDLEQRVASSLYLQTFESGTPAGLSELVMTTATPLVEEER